MNSKLIISLSAKAFIILSALAFLSVSVMAFSNPQSVMDLVRVQLNNTDAFSSIRGVYGGVGFAIFTGLIYLMIKDTLKGLAFLCLLWGSYALSRVVTIFTEGPLGAFGTQWLYIETALFLVAGILLLIYNKSLRPSK